MDDVVSIVEQLDLEPGTCGFMGPTYVGAHGAALYFLITLDRPGHVHQLDADQVYHHYDGAPLDVVFLTAAGPQLHTLGHFGEEGCVPQLIVPAGTVHGSAHPRSLHARLHHVVLRRAPRGDGGDD